MHRPSPRAILEVLPHARLLELGRLHGVSATANPSKDTLVRLLSKLTRGEFRGLIEHLSDHELQTIARVLASPIVRESDPSREALLDALAGPQPHLRLVAEPPNAADSDPYRAPRARRGALRQVSRPASPTNQANQANQANAGETAEAKASRRADALMESTLWQAADKLRNNMDAAEYKHVVLGLIFLKFISDAFEAEKPKGAPRGKRSGFWVPAEARWPALAERAHFPEIGARVDAAMVALERSNPSLRDVLPKHYERPDLDKQRLGELIDLISTIGLGDPADRSRDVLGRVYEYFLTSFAAAEGKNGGQFYTPRSVVGLLVAMLAPYKGTVYDPACGSGGLFVQSERFIEEHGGRPGDIRIFGQESNPTTWRLAKMNLALRGIACDLGPEHADSFHRDLHPDLRADYVLANPPFNCRDWGRERLLDDPRWRYGLPPEKSANFAWVQHFIHHLGPRGLAGFVLANGALSSVTAGEGEIRRAIVEDDLIDCMVALPGKLFYSTQIPVSLWFLARDKRDRRFRARAGESLFIDARGLGTMIDRIHRELTEADIEQLTRTYHAWRGDKGAGAYADVPGFCRAVSIAEVRAHGHMLVPGHFVGTSAEEAAPAMSFVARFEPIACRLEAHLARARALEAEIRALLARLRR
ncbi:MAG: type I restriction-modification system subunit M [Nannocystis sp.]|nr:type I restriction-modification system subunit M [Nannocystis sp.]